MEGGGGVVGGCCRVDLSFCLSIPLFSCPRLLLVSRAFFLCCSVGGFLLCSGWDGVFGHFIAGIFSLLERLLHWGAGEKVGLTVALHVCRHRWGNFL